MAGQKTKRLWDAVSIKRSGGGYGIMLDSRPVHTPAKAPLMLPTQALALKIAEEWKSQGDYILPDSMPFTRIANSAIDKVAANKREVAGLLAAYGDSDLLCYRAASPEGLVERQTAAWDPVLDWAADMLGARLVARTGVMHVAQSNTETARLAVRVLAYSHFELAGFHDLVALTGSLILAFATTRQYREPGEIWALSRIDECWQIEQWGEDDEAQAQESVRRKAFYDAEKFIRLAREKT